MMQELFKATDADEAIYEGVFSVKIKAGRWYEIVDTEDGTDVREVTIH
jgi:hypothetical protein